MAIVTALQADRIGRLGAGHMVVTGITPDYIALAVLALAEGGPELPASLMVVSALFYLAVATWLPQLRRVLTPTVSGTVLMLAAVSVLPFYLDRLTKCWKARRRSRAPGGRRDADCVHCALAEGSPAAALGRRGSVVEPAPAEHGIHVRRGQRQDSPADDRRATGWRRGGAGVRLRGGHTCVRKAGAQRQRRTHWLPVHFQIVRDELSDSALGRCHFIAPPPEIYSGFSTR